MYPSSICLVVNQSMKKYDTCALHLKGGNKSYISPDAITSNQANLE